MTALISIVKLEVVVLQRYSYLWMHGAMTTPGGERAPVCYKSTVLLSVAKSPAFDIDGQFTVCLSVCGAVCLSVRLSLFCCRPDMTFAVDWALSNNYLSIYLCFAVCLSILSLCIFVFCCLSIISLFLSLSPPLLHFSPPPPPPQWGTAD